MAGADLCGGEADEELGQEVQREGGKKTLSEEQTSAWRPSGANRVSKHRAEAREEGSTRQASQSLVQRRERAKQERETRRRLAQVKQEERRKEQEERKQRRQGEREERKLEKEQKRERRLRAREEREQERQERLRWHEEIQHERELRLARKQARMACLGLSAQAKPSVVSAIFGLDEALVSLPKPP